MRYQIDIIESMANIHIRDVPPDALETLRAAARRHRRSLNAEIVGALVGHAERQQQTENLLERLAEGRRRWKKWFPEGFPPGLEPETIIRHDRDTR
jgi:plasmid stability protein